MGSRVINLLQREERRARLRFWKMLLTVDAKNTSSCPFQNDSPENAIAVGTMPKYLRGAFIRAYELRTAERQSEAEVFEEAINDLMQEHFKKIIAERREKGLSEVKSFYLGRNWQVYILPMLA